MAEDPGGTIFNCFQFFLSFSLPQLAIETWQEPRAR